MVAACSRAAWALGVRVGMTATAARELGARRSSRSTPSIERETVRAIADALLAIATARSSSAGASRRRAPRDVRRGPAEDARSRVRRTRDRAARALGVAARVGIADDRFTAWVAAAHGGSLAARRGHGDGAARRLGGVPRAAGRCRCSRSRRRCSTCSRRSASVRSASSPRCRRRRWRARSRRTIRRSRAARAERRSRPYSPDAPIREEIVARGGVLAREGAIDCATAIAMLAGASRCAWPVAFVRRSRWRSRSGDAACVDVELDARDRRCRSARARDPRGDRLDAAAARPRRGDRRGRRRRRAGRDRAGDRAAGGCCPVVLSTARRGWICSPAWCLRARGRARVDRQ